MAKAKDRNDEIIKIRKEIVDFHGEMVLLENYSALNYTGKYDVFLWMPEIHYTSEFKGTSEKSL